MYRNAAVYLGHPGLTERERERERERDYAHMLVTILGSILNTCFHIDQTSCSILNTCLSHRSYILFYVKYMRIDIYTHT